MSERGHLLHANGTPPADLSSLATPGIPLEPRIVAAPMPTPSRFPG
jgi:hypothetical protein